jgi:hypothetical protein
MIMVEIINIEYKMMITDLNVKREFLEYELKSVKEKLTVMENKCSEIDINIQNKEKKSSVTFSIEYICRSKSDYEQKEVIIDKSNEENFIILKKLEAEIKSRDEILNSINNKLDEY